MIVELVRKNGSVTVNELREMFDASESTIRRDITSLDKEGKLEKVFGGAVFREESISSYEATVAQKEELNLEEKKAIAEYAATLVEPDDFVYIDAGTTTACLVEVISEKKATYVTNAFDHAHSLAKRGYKVFLIGGELKASTEAIVGPGAVDDLSRYHFTKGFFGTNGVTRSSGCTTPDLDEAMVKRQAISHCKNAYVVCDREKFDQISPVSFANFDRVTFITDSCPKGYGECSNIIVVDNQAVK